MSPIVPASGTPRASMMMTSSGPQYSDASRWGLIPLANSGRRSSRSGTYRSVRA